MYKIIFTLTYNTVYLAVTQQNKIQLLFFI